VLAQTLEKSYILEPEEDVIPKRFVGCKIEWKDPALDVTVEQVGRGGCVQRVLHQGVCM